MFEYTIFFLFAAMAVIFAVVVITHKNPVISALSLVVSFFALAVMYVLLDAPFIAALQVIVYAGAIMVLFLFVIMLLNLQAVEEPRTRPVQQFAAWLGAIFFGFLLLYFIGKAGWIHHTHEFASSARLIGYELFNAYLLPFELSSILLLAAIVGALSLTERIDKTTQVEVSE